MQAGLDEDPSAAELFAAGRYAAVLQRYETTHPESHLLRVQARGHFPNERSALKCLYLVT